MKCSNASRRRSAIKAPGIDGIPVEVFKTSKDAAEELIFLLTDIWDTERMPADISVGTMLMMHSKDDRRNCRALCLRPHAFNVLSMCFLHRMIPHI